MASSEVSKVESNATQAPAKPSWLGTELAFPPRTYIPVLLLLSLAAGSIDVFSVPALGVFVANNVGRPTNLD